MKSLYTLFKDFDRGYDMEIEGMQQRTGMLMRQKERLSEMTDRIREYDEQQDEINALRKENESLKKKLEKSEALCEEQETEIKNLKIRASENAKLGGRMAAKGDGKDFWQTVRVCLTRSKNKDMQKRISIKTNIMEMARCGRLDIPDDVMDILDTFDDEKPMGNDSVEVTAQTLQVGQVRIENNTAPIEIGEQRIYEPTAPRLEQHRTPDTEEGEVL